MKQFPEIIARELKLRSEQVTATIALFDNGATVPFIARYRKEATGLLDETQIAAVRDRLAQLAELEKRRAAIIVSLTERDFLNDELNQKILSASNLTILEDIYLPYRPKRRTKSTIAKEKGESNKMGGGVSFDPFSFLKKTICIQTDALSRKVE